MDIQEIKSKRAMLEKSIYDLIMGFKKETDLTVSEIIYSKEVHKYNDWISDSRGEMVLGVSVKVVVEI